MRRFAVVIAAAAAAVVFLPPSASAAPCFAPPAGYPVVEFAEPRAYAESQAWWLEGPGNVTVSIADAMRATHLHYGGCFPFMERWVAANGRFELPLKLQMHEFVGGHAKSVGGLGFQNGSVKLPFRPVWAPSSVDEVRFATLSRSSSSVTVCGRRETRGHLEGISPNGGERMFNSFGWQSFIACRPGRTRADQRGPAVMFRGWYPGGDYTNVTFTDDFRADPGFRASQMDAPVVGDLRLKISLGAGANRWLVAVNPNVHGGSFGPWSLAGAGASATVTIPNAVIPPGPFRVMAVGCERLPASAANPAGGQSCGVGVLPFQGD